MVTLTVATLVSTQLAQVILIFVVPATLLATTSQSEETTLTISAASKSNHEVVT